MAPRCPPMAQESFVVSFYSNYQGTADNKGGKTRATSFASFALFARGEGI